MRHDKLFSSVRDVCLSFILFYCVEARVKPLLLRPFLSEVKRHVCMCKEKYFQ